MRTSLDLPDTLFRTLKANAALQGLSLRDHVLQLIERGMQRGPQTPIKRAPRPVSPIPMLNVHHELSVDRAALVEGGAQTLLDQLELERYLNVVKAGSSSGQAKPE